MSEMLKTMLNRIEHNKNALKTKRYYVEDLISNEELIILVEEIERLNKKIEQYENPEDMTLMFMWCDEKAKDEIKRLNNIINELEKYINEDDWTSVNTEIAVRLIKLKLQELKGSDKVE